MKRDLAPPGFTNRKIKVQGDSVCEKISVAGLKTGEPWRRGVNVASRS